MMKSTAEQAADIAVHYSLKYRNSNITGGIRLEPGQQSHLPYISGRTMLSYTGLLCDRAGKSAPNIKHLFDFKKEQTVLTDVQINDKIEFTNITKSTGLVLEADNLNVRLPQILVLKGDEYISLTPTSPVCFPYIISQKLNTIKERSSNRKSPLHRVQINQGGAKNPHNVGAFASVRQCDTIYVAPPSPSPLVKQLYAWYYKGGQIKIPVREYSNYRTFIDRYRLTRGSTTKRYRTKEILLLNHIVDKIRTPFNQIYVQLKKHQDLLPTADLLSPDVNYRIRGLIIPSAQTDEWATECGKYVSRLICDFVDSNNTTLTMDQHAVDSITSIIKTRLLCQI